MKNSKPGVLIVDDELYMRLMIKHIIDDIGYQFMDEACDGDEAVRIFKEKSPDMIILDIKMPGKSGDKALKEIKEISSDVCIIVLTSVSDEETMQICLDYGATCYITKDTPISDIEKIIKETWETYSQLRMVVSP